MDLSSTNISLLSRIRDKADDAAWREFDARYRELMLRYCRRRGLDQVDAKDVVQATLTGLSESLPRFTYGPLVRPGVSDWLFNDRPHGLGMRRG